MSIACSIITSLIGTFCALSISSPLQCDPALYKGITKCTTDSGKTHLLKVDLATSGVRIETIMANDADTVNPPSAQRELVATMAERYRERGQSPQ